MGAMNNTMLPGKDRRRNSLTFSVSDLELEIINELLEEHHVTRTQMLRTAVEQYFGRKIFRENAR